MRSDDTAGPSLLLAQHDIAHREHLHQHHQFHNRRQTATAQDSTVVEVVATISYVQVIDVDANGSTFAVQTVLAAASTGGTGAALTEASSPSTTTAASPGTSNPPSAASSTLPGDLSAAGASLSLNSTTSASVKSIPTSFTSLIANSNATALISGSSSKAFSNSTITSSWSSLTYLTSTTLTIDESATSTISSFYTPSYSSSRASSATPGVILGGATGVGSGSASSSSAAAGNDNGSGSSTPPSTPVVVGGVVGGVAGAAIVIFLLMVLIRWKKRHGTMISLGSGDPGPGEATTRALPSSGPSGPPGPSGGMTERRSLAFAVPAALANLTGYKRSSQRTETDRTISSTAESERGFYRVSGRKLPSVLQSGGDGYGGGIGVDANTLSGSSFYRDSQGFYGGPGSPSFAPGAQPQQRDSAGGIPIMRPSPARTPVTEHGPFSAVPPPLTPPRRPDVLGRSHPSQDGSHTSRFTEEV